MAISRLPDSKFELNFKQEGCLSLGFMPVNGRSDCLLGIRLSWGYGLMYSLLEAVRFSCSW
jgi:hypothetical protein